MFNTLYKKIKGQWEQILYTNFIAKWYFSRKRKQVLTKTFLMSSAYDNIFLGKADSEEKTGLFLDDAEKRTKDFRYRHGKMSRILGCWRWKGLYQHKQKILPILFDKEKRGIDFGGAFGPVSMHTTVVDFAEKDIFHRKIKYKSLQDIDFTVDYIFSSHTLEHIEALESVFSQMQKILKKGGQLILNLPAYSCKRWRHGVHSNKKFNDHKWTFILAGTSLEENIPKLLEIDTLIKQYFTISFKTYTGDNSIFIIADHQ